MAARNRQRQRERGALPLPRRSTADGAESGVSSAKAEAGDAPMPAIRPSEAAIRSAPNARQRSILTVSRSDAAVLSARPAISAAATITSPGE